MPSPLSAIDRDVLTVANLVRTSRALTRQELASRTGMSRNTISTLIASAIETGLLVPDGSAPSTGGRAPQTWRFHHEAGLIMVAGVHSSALHLAVTDLAGHALCQRMVDWPIMRGPEETLDEVARQMREMAENVQASSSRPLEVWGAGVSLPGPIDQSTGRPTAPPIMPGWDRFDVRGHLDNRLGVPVAVDNDVNTMLLGYATTLPDQRLRCPRDILYLQIGTGIGAGIMSAGHVHRGADGAAGDIGHVRVTDADSVVCRCGRTGCLEAVAGGWSLLRDARRAAAEGLSPHLATRLEDTGTLTLEDIVSGVLAGDTECLTLMVRSATAVGDALAMLVSFFNPSQVILAGALPQGCPMFLDVAHRIVSERALILATAGLQVTAAASGLEDERRGAALLTVNALFNAATRD